MSRVRIGGIAIGKRTAFWGARAALLLLVLRFVAGPVSAGAATTVWPGNIDPGFEATCITNAAYNNAVSALVVQADGRIVAGGAFWNPLSFPPQPPRTCANAIFRCDPDGSPDRTFSSPFGLFTQIHAMLLMPDGELLVAGRLFGLPNDSDVVRLDANGGVDRAFLDTQSNGVSGISPVAKALAVDSAGRIWVGGQKSVNQTGVYPALRRLNPDGTVDGTAVMSPILGVEIRALAAQPDGRIVIGGQFTNVDGTMRSGLARLQEHGPLDETFQPPFTDAVVNGLQLLPNGRVLAVGRMSTNGSNFAFVVRLRADGSMDPTFNLIDGGAETGRALVTQSDGQIIVVTDQRVLRLHANGLPDPSYSSAGGVLTGAGFSAVGLDETGAAWVGAEWAQQESTVRRGLIRLQGGNVPQPTPPLIEIQPDDATAWEGDDATFHVTASGSEPFGYSWYFGGVRVARAATVILTHLHLTNDNTPVFCVVTNQYGAATSSVARLHVVPRVGPAITAQPANLTATIPPPVTRADLTESSLAERFLQLRVSGGSPPFPSSGAFLVRLDATGHTYAIPAGELLPPTAGSWTFGVEPGFDAVLTFEQFIPDPGGGPVKLGLRADGTYTMATMEGDGTEGEQHGTFQIRLLNGDKLGTVATFQVAAAGTPPLSYQWFRGNAPLHDGISSSIPRFTGTHSATLVISNVTSSSAGPYYCVVSNAAGVAASTSAVLTVVGPPPLDTVPPTLALTVPRASAIRVVTNRFELQGTARDASGLAGVWVRVDANPPVPADGTTAWKAGVELVPGTNHVQIMARDLEGNDTASVNRSLFYAVPAPLTLSVTGQGSIVGATNGQALEVGRRYLLTAVPAPGFTFSNWAGRRFPLSQPTLAFYMSNNLALTANFVPTPFVAGAGDYNGLFVENSPVRRDLSGFVKVTLQPSGSFSARLQLGGKKVPFTGQFDLLGRSIVVVKRSGADDLTVDLTMNLLGAEQITGRVFDNISSSDLIADRATFQAATQPATHYAGDYTWLVPGGSDECIPDGNGIGAVSITTAGKVKVTGILADGSVVSQNVPLSRDGSWPLYASLREGRGSILGWVQITNAVSVWPDLGGVVRWTRRPSKPGLMVCPEGFSSDLELIGSRYQPVGTNRLLEAARAIVSFVGGDLMESFSNTVALLPAGKVEGTNDLTLKVNSANGFFSGNAMPPGGGRRLAFKGVLLQKQNYGGGFFPGPTGSGQVRLEPVQEINLPE